MLAQHLIDLDNRRNCWVLVNAANFHTMPIAKVAGAVLLLCSGLRRPHGSTAAWYSLGLAVHDYDIRNGPQYDLADQAIGFPFWRKRERDFMLQSSPHLPAAPRPDYEPYPADLHRFAAVVGATAMD